MKKTANFWRFPNLSPDRGWKILDFPFDPDMLLFSPYFLTTAIIFYVQYVSSTSECLCTCSSACITVCTCVCVCVCVCVVSEVMRGVCPGGLKRLQVARSAICRATTLGWYLATCSAEFKTHCMCTHTHTHTQTHTWPHKVCTQTRGSLEGRDEKILLISLGDPGLETVTIHLTTWPWDAHALPTCPHT